jgi:hypothetical protein
MAAEGHNDDEGEGTESLIRPKHDEGIDRFAPTFLETLAFRAHKQAEELLEAVQLLQALNESGARPVSQDAPTGFISDAWWEYLLDAKGNLSRRYYELAVLWQLRLALRSGDI